MMEITKVCMLGTSLFVTCATHAQSFVVEDMRGDFRTFGESYTLGDPNGNGDTAFAMDGVLRDTLSRTPDGSEYGDNRVSTSLTSDTARIDGGYFGGGDFGAGSGAGFLQVFFTVADDIDLEFSWDISNSDGAMVPTLFRGGIGNEEAIFQHRAVATGVFSGSAVVSLVAGEQYTLTMEHGDPLGLNVQYPSVGNNWIQAKLVPAPSVMGLSCLAGLAASRRRRTS